MIKERIIQLIENKGIAKEKFYKKIGMTSANFRGKAKETPINSNAIENILSEIPDLNIIWLLTGKGEMLKPEISVALKNEQKKGGSSQELPTGQQMSFINKKLGSMEKDMSLLKSYVTKSFQTLFEHFELEIEDHEELNAQEKIKKTN